ncbi:MAG: arginase [Planctomycetota bacterium]
MDHSPSQPIALLGVPMDLGGNRRGVDMGPSALRIAGLAERIRALGLTVEDCGNINVVDRGDTAASDPSARYLDAIVETCGALAERVREMLGSGRFPLVMGGDHSIAAGTVAGVAAHHAARGQSIGLIWFDAHADMNTPRTSESGNVHGMPLAAIIGDGPAGLTGLAGTTPMVQPRNVALVGIRSVDALERETVLASGVRCFTMKEIDQRGVRAVMEDALRHACDGTAGFHLSFDVDGTDPGVCPGVGTPVPGGMSYREAHTVCEMVAESGRLVSLEFTEINPILDERNRTALAAVEFALSALGKTVI